MTDLQVREVFHLAFLRALVPGPMGQHLVLKGGANLRFFYASARYSEDVDLDAADIAVDALRDRVMTVLHSPTFLDTLRTYGIARIVPPDMRVAKQTATVQRFKVHLLTTADTDLSTRVEFSRRGLDAPILVEGVAPTILAAYRMPPLVLRHYGVAAAIRQKLRALLGRTAPQARDVFDLFILSSQPEALSPEVWQLSGPSRRQIRETVLAIGYGPFRDTVVSYLRPEEREQYGHPTMWDTIRLTVVDRIEAAERL
jgi:hypothetical protein